MRTVGYTSVGLMSSSTERPQARRRRGAGALRDSNDVDYAKFKVHPVGNVKHVISGVVS